MKLKTKLLITLFTGMVFFMSNSCASTGTVSKEVNTESVKATELQKIMASKANKFVTVNNPAILHKFTADPCVLVYEDTVYMYGTSDAQQAEYSLGAKDNGYEKINTLNVFSSKDLVNWTDCGEIPVGGKSNPKGAAKWANNSWAPAICTKKIDGKDKFFLYFADSANGIGVLTADSPTGPFIDPIGKGLVTRGTPNCEGVHWMFDPAVLVDDDGKGYLYFGGGVKDDVANPKSSRVVALGDDMISLAGTPVQIDPPFLFEDSGINKINGKYYYSYCANWNDRKDFPGADVPPIAVICYMMSDSPMGPFKYMGYALKNPGTYFGAWGNNHHWLFEFKNKLYMAYHGQVVEKTIGFEKGGYRNLIINEFTVNADGTWPIQNMTKEGVTQIGAFNVNTTVPAATMHSARNVIVTSKQTLYPMADKGYVLIKGADVGNINGKTLSLKLGEGHNGGKITIAVDHFASGTVISEVEIGNETAVTAPVTLADGDKIRNLYIVFQGDVELVSWEIK